MGMEETVQAANASLPAHNRRDVEASWQRCMEAGMEPGDDPDAQRVGGEELKALYVEDARVRGLALAEMRILDEHLRQHGFTLTLANAGSVILDRFPGWTGRSVRRDADELAPGNRWHEAARGTNAVGTAAHSKRPIVVVGKDHFLRTYANLICIAMPVFNPSGDLAAVLDATRHGGLGPRELNYVLGLMHMSAEHVETELFKEQHQSSLVVQMIPMSRGAGGGTAALAFDEGGRLETVSRGAASSLQDLDVRAGLEFGDIFRTDFRSLRRRIDWPVDFLDLEDLRGRRYQATV
ncbi:MAG TPA: GAF domain-containing protein [Gammaproteobacteria bacterium]|nr:GAF domain-containing protein [Gammaproteobacteria bacterium]